MLLQSTTIYPSCKDSQNIPSSHSNFLAIHNLDSTSIPCPLNIHPIPSYFQVLNSTSNSFFTSPNHHSIHIQLLLQNFHPILTSPNIHSIHMQFLSHALNPPINSLFTFSNPHSFHISKSPVIPHQIRSSWFHIPTHSHPKKHFPQFTIQFPFSRFRLHFYISKSPLNLHPTRSSHLQIPAQSWIRCSIPNPHSIHNWFFSHFDFQLNPIWFSHTILNNQLPPCPPYPSQEWGFRQTWSHDQSKRW